MFTAAKYCSCIENYVDPVLKKSRACNQYGLCFHSYITEHHYEDIQKAMSSCCDHKCVSRVYKNMGDELGVSIFIRKEPPGTDDDS